jgi:hypothetical protein
MPLEATGRRVGEAAALPGELLCLANVVKDCPEEEQVPVYRVDLREPPRHPQALDRVLQEAANAGVVHALGGGGRAKRAPEFLVGDHTVK